MIRIAIQSKGRLHDDTMQLLAEADVKLGTSKRALISESSTFPLQALYLRDDDIPETVASGVADLGVVGENEFVERGYEADIVARLGFGKCRLSLAVPKDTSYNGLPWFEGRRIATSYPAILKSFLEKNNIKAEVQVINGSVEISPAIGLADAIFDIVSSGSTLVSNNLREVEVVMKSEALLIANRALSDEKRETLEKLLFRIDAVRSADEKKYVLMNVPREKVDVITKVLPGVKSPTIMPLADPAWCSVHTVLEEKRFWEIIGQLKENGAQGILVLPIEKMIL
jgi:ATP phosphoribosyltransferase